MSKLAGAKHTSSGDETPPIPEEELEQQKIEHERQMQKEKETQAREAEEVAMLDEELLHQRAIEAEEEQKREMTDAMEKLRGMNTSWSHHQLCDLQRQARWRHSRPSIPDAAKPYKSILKKYNSAQLEKPHSSRSIGESDVIFRTGPFGNEILDNESYCEPHTCPNGNRDWRASTSDVPQFNIDRNTPTSCFGKGLSVIELPQKPISQHVTAFHIPLSLNKHRNVKPFYEIDNTFATQSSGAISVRVGMSRREGSKEGREGQEAREPVLSRSESSVSRCTPHTPLGPTDSVSVDSNLMPSIYRCRAPIASLDCMDDFSANSQQMLDQAGIVTRNMVINAGMMSSVVTPGLRYNHLGKSGLRVPNIGLGLWSLLNEESSEDIIMAAIESGINLFDLSEAHNAKGEIELGRILKKRNIKRTSVIIITKIYWSTKSDERGLSRKHILESVKSSLQRLQVEYIDVVLLHKLDPVCPMEELVRTMTDLINKGWIMYWGTGRWSPTEIMDAYSICRQFNCVTPIVEQTEYHMFCREKAELYMPDLHHKIGVGLMVWSAITTGKGLGREEITGLFAKSRFNRKYSTFSWCEEDLTVPEMQNSDSKENICAEEPRTYGDKLRDLATLANVLNCSMSQLAVAWCLKNEAVACILLGATSVEQLREHIHALQIVPQLTPSVMAEIERLLSNKPIRPPMISTLAMRSQQNSNTVRVDMTGATIPDSSPKAEADEAGVSSPSKDDGRSCEIQ